MAADPELDAQVERLRLVVEDLRAAQAGPAPERHGDRERTVAAALDGLADQLNQFTSTLAGEIRRTGEETAAASRAQLDTAVRAVTDAAARIAATTDVMPRVDRAIAAIGEVRQELAAVTTRLDPTARLEALAESTARIDARLAQSTTSVAQQVRDALAERDATDDVTPALDAMRADLRQAVRALTTEQPAALDRLPAAVDALAGDLAGIGARLDEVRARNEVTGRDLAALADVPATLSRLAEDLAALATLPAAIDGLGGAVEGAVAVHRRSAAAVETLQQSIDAARADIGAAAGTTQHLEQRLDEATAAAAAANHEALEAALAQQREAEAAAADALDRRLAALGDAIDALAARPTPETGVAAAVRALGVELTERHEADTAAGAELAGRLAARAEADAATASKVAAIATALGLGDAAGDDLATRLARLEDAIAGLSEHAAATVDTVTAIAGTLTARAEGGDDPDATLTKGALDDALAALSAELTDGPALATVEDLRTAVITLRADLAQLAKTAETLVNRPVPTPPPTASPSDLEAAVGRLEERLAEIPAPISTTELDAAVAGIRLAITTLPTPPAVDEIAAAVRVTLPELPATAADIQRATAAIAAAVDERLGGNVLEDFRAEVARIVEFRNEILGTITDLRQHGPMAAASVGDVQAAAEGVAGAVRDAVAGATADLRAELDLVRRAVDGLQALRELGGADRAPTDVDLQLDAIGRLVGHAVTSLHLIEESTVGVSSGSIRTRADANAAAAELEAARQRRAARLS